jgi:hypothetical protein
LTVQTEAVLSFDIIANHKFSGGLEIKKKGRKKNRSAMVVLYY